MATGAFQAIGLLTFVVVCIASPIGNADEIPQGPTAKKPTSNNEDDASPANEDARLRAEAEQLNVEIEALCEAERFAEAIPIASRVSELCRQALGADHPEYGLQLHELASLYDAAGDYQNAETNYQLAADIWKRALGENDPYYAGALTNLAGLYKAKGDYQRALPLYQRVCEIRGVAFGKDHPAYSSSIGDLALLYKSMGDFNSALPLCLQAIEINKQALGENHPDYAASLNSLALLYQDIGDYSRALPLCQQATSIAEESFGADHPAYAIALGNLAGLHQSMGDYARALPLMQESLRVFEQAVGMEHPQYTSGLSNLALLHRSMGDYAQAILLLQKVVELDEKTLGMEHPDYATSLSNLAVLYSATGESNRALSLHEQALEIKRITLGEEHPSYATTLSNMATLHAEAGDYDRALPLLQKTSEIDRQGLGDRHPDYAHSLCNLSVLYQSIGDYPRALPLSQAALDIRKQSLGTEHADYAKSLFDLAQIHYSLGDELVALPLLRDAFAISLGHLDRTSAVQTEQQQLALGQSLVHQLDTYLTCAIAVDDQADNAFAAVLTWKGATLVRQRASRLAAEEPELAPIFAELQVVTRRWAALAQSGPAGGADGWRERVAELSAEKDRLEVELSLRSAAYRQLTEKITPERLKASLPADAVLIDYLVFNRYTHEETEVDGEKRSRWNTEPSLLAFVVARDGPAQMFDLGPMAPVAEAIDAWRVSFGASAEGVRAGRLLRETIWQPLLKSIGDARTVLVSPDGALGRMPIAAIPGKDPGSYLIEDHRLAMVPVPQLIPAMVNDAGRRELEHELLLLGGVDYDQRDASASETEEAEELSRGPLDQVTTGRRWNPLPGAAAEMRFIADLYQGLGGDAAIITLSETKASEQSFRQFAPTCSVLHLATHGFFADAAKQSALSTDATADRGLRSSQLGQPEHLAPGQFSPGLLSGLVFAGANQPAAGDDDGYLTASELAFLPLNGVELVVLSACETGLGAVAGGEGLLGVQRAMQVSGARSTVASLWSVDDHATQELMQNFYKNYAQQDMSPLDALREAQLAALNSLRQTTADTDRGGDLPEEDDFEPTPRLSPRYWAAFSLSGDWR